MDNEANLSSGNITIEGITLTPDSIKTIKQWQEGNVQYDINTLDDAIAFIVSTPPEDVEQAFDLVYRIVQLKDYLKTIKS